MRHHEEERSERQALGRIEKLLHQLNRKIETMSIALDRLNASATAQAAAIAANTAAIEAAIAAGIGTAPAGDSQDALNAVADAVDKNTADAEANTAKLAAATPAPTAPAA